MKIVLLTTGTLGDINPFLALAKELYVRDHEIRFCTDRWYEAAVTSLPVEYHPTSSLLNQESLLQVGDAVSRAPSPLAQFAILRDFHLQDGPDHYKNCYEAIKGCDLTVCHAIHTIGQVAAMDQGIPWVRVVLDPSLTPTASHPPLPFPNLGGWLNTRLWKMVERSLSPLDQPLKELLDTIGSKQRDVRMFRTPSPLLNLFACSTALTGAFQGLAGESVFTGFWRMESTQGTLPAALQSFLDAHSGPVVVSMGSMATEDKDSLQAIIDDVFAGLDVPVVVQGGAARLSAEALGDRGISTGHVDHHLLLPHAACVVHHGGAGTAAAACLSGVPSVVIPHFGDQFYWSSCLYRRGVAPKPIPRKKLTAQRLASTLGEVLASRQFKEQALALQSRMGSDPGVHAASDLIEGITGTG